MPGIVASLAAGTAIIAFRPGDDSMLLLSALFGVGAALVLDEFALILHLDDVYWTKEGRASVEATLMGFSFGAICLLATAPLHSDPSQDVPHSVLGGLILLNLTFALVAFLKGKPWLGFFGIFIPGIAIIAAIRLATPTSLWARRFYTAGKLERSRARADIHQRRHTRVRHRLYDAIGGKPHLESRRTPPSHGGVGASRDP